MRPLLASLFAAFLLAAFLFLPAGSAQDQAQTGANDQDDSVIRVDVNLVDIYFSVRDKDNRFITSLNREDFTVLEDGQPQEIRNFSRETDLPLTIGLLVDVSGSQQNLLDIERHAASQFFQQVLRPKKDLAFLISFGSEAELLQDYTGSPNLLEEGLDNMHLSVSLGGLGPGPVPTAQRKGTILFDTVYLAADEMLKGEVGRKVLVLITDGIDLGSHYKREDAIRAAHKSDAIVYSIYYSDPGAYGGFGGGGDGDLKKLSEETGGRLFRVSNKQPLDEIFSQIQEEMRSQYALGYSPTNDKHDGSFRGIEIKTSDRNMRVQARKGYYAPSDRQ
jgi:VWFA-related protein